MIGLYIYAAGAALIYYVFMRLATAPTESVVKITITNPYLAVFPLWQIGVLVALMWPLVVLSISVAVVAKAWDSHL